MDRIEVDALLESLPRARHEKSLVKGVGLNDSPFRMGMTINGRVVNHRAYDIWSGILQRCYDKKFQKAHPHYAGCSVCDEWLIFSNFFAWWKEHQVDGWEVDKDFKLPGNRIYSPNHCLFIPKEVNAFIVSRGKKKSELPMGVSYLYRLDKYKATISRDGSHIHLGLFKTAEEANQAWVIAKLKFAYSYKDVCDRVGAGVFDMLINKVLSHSVSQVEAAELKQIWDDIETAAHLKKLRAMRAA